MVIYRQCLFKETNAKLNKNDEIEKSEDMRLRIFIPAKNYLRPRAFAIAVNILLFQPRVPGLPARLFD